MAGKSYVRFYHFYKDFFLERSSCSIVCCLRQRDEQREQNVPITFLYENDDLSRPDRIFYMDNSGVWINNAPRKVIGIKFCIKSVKTVTFGVKGHLPLPKRSV